MVGRAAEHQGAADKGDDDVHDVADVAQQRHKDVGKTVAVAGVVENLAVDLVKVRLGGFLVAEDLDDLLTGHHLFHKGFGIGDGDLLAQEELGRTRGDGAGREHHTDNADDDQRSQDHAVIDHDAEHHKQRDAGDGHLGQALADELTQRVDVVGVVAHDIAVAVGVKVTDRQILHVAEHLLAQFAQRALGDDGHHLGVEGAGRQADEVHDDQDAHEREDLPRHGGPVARLIVVIHDLDDVLHKDGRGGADDCVDHDTEHRDGQQHRVKLKQGAQQTAQHTFGRTLAARRGGTGLRSIILRHSAHLPYSGKYRPRGRSRWSSSALRGCRWR